MKLVVAPEGRPGVWLGDKKNIAAWIRSRKWKQGKIHNFIPAGPAMLGADWPIKDVIATVRQCDRLAILTGLAQRQNYKHALSVITGNRLDLFDIGQIDEAHLQIIGGRQ